MLVLLDEGSFGGWDWLGRRFGLREQFGWGSEFG